MILPPNFPAAGYVADYAVFWIVWFAVVAGTVLFFRRTRGATGRLRLVAGNVLVFGSLVSTLVVAGETYLRYVYDATDSYGLTLTNFAWFNRHVTFNSDGFRDREYDPAWKPGVTRVACVGDSFTVGYGVPDVADVWPQRVGAALERARPGLYDVHNCGLIGRDTGEQVNLVRHLAGRTAASQTKVAEHVILGYCLNDMDDLMPPGRRFNRMEAPRVTWMKPTRSFVWDFLWFRLKLRDDPRVRGYCDWVDVAYTDPTLLEMQAARFKAIADTCRAAGMRLDVVVFPFFSGWGPDYRWDAAHERVAELWKAAAGIEVIDLRADYRGIPEAELVVSRFDAHPNARAQEIAARVVLDRVFDVR